MLGWWDGNGMRDKMALWDGFWLQEASRLLHRRPQVQRFILPSQLHRTVRIVQFYSTTISESLTSTSNTLPYFIYFIFHYFKLQSHLKWWKLYKNVIKEQVINYTFEHSIQAIEAPLLLLCLCLTNFR